MNCQPQIYQDDYLYDCFLPFPFAYSMISDLLPILQKQHSEHNALLTLWLPRAKLSDQLVVIGMLDGDLDNMLGSDATEATQVMHVRAVESARLLLMNMPCSNPPTGVLLFSGMNDNGEFIAALGPSPVMLGSSLYLMDNKFHVPA